MVHANAVAVRLVHQIVNVWDAPIGLQTKAGIKKGHAKITGEKTNYLSDKGRLGTTV